MGVVRDETFPLSASHGSFLATSHLSTSLGLGKDIQSF